MNSRKTKRFILKGYEEKRRVISDMERRRKNYIKEPMLKTIVEDIFCFKEQKLEASSEDYENPAIRKMMRSIDEAAHTHYVRGRWVTEPHFPHGNFSLITTTLPASGDYIAYARARSKDEASYKREADNILAGVSFLNHMVNTVADIIKIPLPKRVNIRDFINLTSEDLEKTKFKKLVTRINANVLFLCLSQEVPSNSLLPLSPLINMNALFTNPTIDIGRLGSFEIPQSIIDQIDDDDEQDDFSDSDDSDSGEWNMVNASNLSDIPTVSPPRRRISFDDTASNVVTSAAASVLSIFGLGNN
ncbi:Beclin 1-associated autophagy-related key regulator [Armadillidium nasatum]|uniref:Beclin 1-associated autophagy-related key regulator n=1 Tax=Armadillidium nasatum TaxID=96803 RepID=A0A5N5TLC8_9CRUS|nr:Beclin 1-associated autophagy-related key regulator [Armadillidium nasatum]